MTGSRLNLALKGGALRLFHGGPTGIGDGKHGTSWHHLKRVTILDRIDLHVEVDPVSAADLSLPPPAEGSQQVAARVAAAREIQTARLDGTGARTNAELDGDALERFATPDEPGRRLLMQAAEAMRLSARGYTRILRVSRTIADLSGTESVGRIHVAEALSYRRQPPRA